MYLEIIKRHVAGLEVGQFTKANGAYGQQLIEEGYAKEATEEDFLKWKEKFLKEKNNKKSDKPISQWTLPELKEEAKRLKIPVVKKSDKSETGEVPKTKKDLLIDIEDKK